MGEVCVAQLGEQGGRRALEAGGGPAIRRDPAPHRHLGGNRCRVRSVLLIVPDRADFEGQNGGELGGIRIWAGIVSESETDPAQMSVCNDSTPDWRRHAGSRRTSRPPPPSRALRRPSRSSDRVAAPNQTDVRPPAPSAGGPPSCTRRRAPARTAPGRGCTPCGRRGQRHTDAAGRPSASASWRRTGTTSSSSVTTTAVGTETSPTQRRESKRPMARPAATICSQSWRATSSSPHHEPPRRRRQSFHRPSAARVSLSIGTAPAITLVPAATPKSTRSRTVPENLELVAHSTNPSTSSRWRSQISWAIGPPIE